MTEPSSTTECHTCKKSIEWRTVTLILPEKTEVFGCWYDSEGNALCFPGDTISPWHEE